MELGLPLGMEEVFLVNCLFRRNVFHRADGQHLFDGNLDILVDCVLLAISVCLNLQRIFCGSAVYLMEKAIGKLKKI